MEQQKPRTKLEAQPELSDSAKLVEPAAEVSPGESASTAIDPPAPLPETSIDVLGQAHADHGQNESKVFASPDQAVDAMLAREDKYIGKILGGIYRIESKLGAGGMSVVYKAQHLLLQQTMVIKFIAHEHFDDFKSVRRFSQEAKASSILSHPNVVVTREFGVTEDGRPFIVMDYVDGIPLSDLIEQRAPLKPERAIELILPVCEGLKHAHEKGIVHRDIKPANIIIEDEGGEKETAKIVDFGIAKNTTVPAADKLTQTGEVFGSPSYMSPEQCKGQSVDARSDIYSLGCVLVELLTGHPPFEGTNALETLVMHMTADLPEFPNLPPDLENIIVKALERDLSKRYQSIAEMESALESANLGSGVRAKRRKKRVKFFTRTRLIVYASIIVISTLSAIIAAAINVYKNNEWHSTLGVAEKAALQGNYPLMENRFQLALQQAKQCDSFPIALVDIHQDMGDCYQFKHYKNHDQGDYDRYRSEYTEAYNDAMAGGNEYQKSHIGEKMGDLYWEAKDYATAEKYYDEALVHRIKWTGKDSLPVAVTEIHMGRNYIAEGKYAKAEPVLLHALAVYKGLSDDQNGLYEIDVLRQLAINAARAHKDQDALKYFDQAIDLAKLNKICSQAYRQGLEQARDDFKDKRKIDDVGTEK